MSTDYLIAGGAGQLGRALRSMLGPRALAADLPDLDITSPDSVQRLVRETDPVWIINCAAITDVDYCQRNPDQAIRVHRDGVANLASTGRRLLTLSTDQVFSGGTDRKVPVTENDTTSPCNTYGRSKLMGEEIALKADSRNVVVRTSWMFSSCLGLPSFLWRELVEKGSVSAVTDQRACLTFAPDLADGICRILDGNEGGIFHLVNRPGMTPVELAERISGITGGRVEPVGWDDLHLEAPRPVFSELDSNRDILLPNVWDAFERWRSENA